MDSIYAPCRPSILSTIAYLDTVALNFERRRDRDALASALRSIGVGSIHAHGSRDWSRPWRLVVDQPGSAGVERIAKIKSDRKRVRLTEVHVALDCVVATVADAVALDRWFRHRLLVTRGRKPDYFHREGDGGIGTTTYFAPRRWDARVDVLYAEPTGRIDPRPVARIEFRTRGRAVAALGFYQPADLAAADLDEWIAKHVQLARVDPIALGRVILRRKLPGKAHDRETCRAKGESVASRLPRWGIDGAPRFPDDTGDHAQLCYDFLTRWRYPTTPVKRLDIRAELSR